MYKPEQLKAYLQNVLSMRRAQQEYFKAPKGSDRSRKALKEAKELEAIIDRMTPKAINYAESLFLSERLIAYLQNVLSMRKAQQEYFKAPKRSDQRRKALKAAKALEAIIDEMTLDRLKKIIIYYNLSSQKICF